MKHRPGDFKSHYLLTPTTRNEFFMWVEYLGEYRAEHFNLILTGASFAGQQFERKHKGSL